MKSKTAVLFLIVLLCLTTGCNNASHIAETPDPISSSDSNIVPSESETAQAEKKTEVDRPKSTESQTDSRAAENPASVSESDTQTTEVPDQADHITAVLPQPSEPEKKTDESERRPETVAPTEKEQPTPPATEESKPVDQPQPTEPPKQESTEPAFDISYWISFAKSYAESVGLTLNSEAVYCWDTAVELTPEGTGYRAKTRFARFYNLPELMAMFKEIADIKTADMLDLPVPKAVFHNISVKPSEIQKQMVAELAERAERVRNGMVDAKEDNMLKITNDGRKLALDQRLINPLLPDFEDSKLNACVDAMFETWERGSEKRLTQLFFCDLSTPKNDGSFNVYDDIRQKLIARGVPADEIKFIHEADTEAKKLELFKKVRRGDVRILMGSTQKMGAGTNVQNKLAASSDLDCPWRPSDLEQRLGRSIRQGNENAEVHIYRFVTEETFDAYLYQLVEGKQKFASQIMTSKSPVRSCEDIDETALSYAEIKMLATGNPHIKEKMDLDIQVQKLRLLKSSFLSEKYALEDKIIKFYPQEIARRTDVIAGLKSDIERVAEHPKPSDETFVGMTVKGAFYSEKADAGNAILEACKAMTNPEPIPLGEYRGFTMELYFEAREYKVRLKGELGYPVTLGMDTFGNITRLDNALEGLPKRLEMNEMELDNIKKQFETAKVDVERPFPQEEELKAKTDRLNELNALLNVDKRENEIVGGEPDEGEEPPEKKPRDLER